MFIFMLNKRITRADPARGSWGSGPMMNIITINKRAHKGASCFGVLFLDDASLKSVALHSSYIIQASESRLRNLTWGRGGGAADLISFNNIVRTRKIAYVIPAIFFYDSLDIYIFNNNIYTCQELGGFHTAGYIVPLKIYAADVQGTK